MLAGRRGRCHVPWEMLWGFSVSLPDINSPRCRWRIHPATVFLCGCCFFTPLLENPVAFRQVTFKKKSALNFGFGLYFDFVYQIAFFGHITIISVLKIGYMSKKSLSVSPNPWVFYTLPFFHFAFSFVCFCFFSFFCKNIKKRGEF